VYRSEIGDRNAVNYGSVSTTVHIFRASLYSIIMFNVYFSF